MSLTREELIQYYTRFATETIYLYNDEYECYIKSVPGVGWFVKFPGQEEGRISASSKNAVYARDARNEVSKSEYENC